MLAQSQQTVEISRARGLARTAERELNAQQGELTRLRRKIGTMTGSNAVSAAERELLEGRVEAERRRLRDKEQEAEELEGELAQSIGLAEQQQTRLEALVRRVAELEKQSKEDAATARVMEDRLESARADARAEWEPRLEAAESKARRDEEQYRGLLDSQEKKAAEDRLAASKTINQLERERQDLQNSVARLGAELQTARSEAESCARRAERAEAEAAGSKAEAKVARGEAERADERRRQADEAAAAAERDRLGFAAG